MKQGNREYVERLIGTNYGEKNFIYLQFKSRTKFSDQMLPLGQTMIDSFKFTDTKIPLVPLNNNAVKYEKWSEILQDCIYYCIFGCGGSLFLCRRAYRGSE